jgi:chemotaxis protein methyltransferase CheR
MTRAPRSHKGTAPTGLAEAGITAEELNLICAFLYRRTGMLFEEKKRYYIDRRIAATGTRSFPAYFAYLQSKEREAELLVNSFTVNETYFYREEHQLLCLGRDLLPATVANRKPGDLVRIWSVPCSTGEEPYSIAIWLLENWALVDAYHIEIVGSDIDTRAVEDAKAGYFGERSLSRLSKNVVEQYFEPPQDGTRRLIQDLRESVRFTQVNLVDETSMAAQGRFDIVFCRNVLIYFDEASRQIAADTLYDALQPGGFICLGHTESMTRISKRFTTRRFDDAIVYQRPEKA